MFALGVKHLVLEDYLLLTSQLEIVLSLQSAFVQPQLPAVGSHLDKLEELLLSYPCLGVAAGWDHGCPASSSVGCVDRAL